MFRFKKSIPLSYEDQGYIYFYSMRYQKLPKGGQELIEAVSLEAGGEYAAALLEFVTTDAGAAKVCGRHYLSEKSLERAVEKYYLMMAQKI